MIDANNCSSLFFIYVFVSLLKLPLLREVSVFFNSEVGSDARGELDSGARSAFLLQHRKEKEIRMNAMPLWP